MSKPRDPAGNVIGLLALVVIFGGLLVDGCHREAGAQLFGTAIGKAPAPCYYFEELLEAPLDGVERFAWFLCPATAWAEHCESGGPTLPGLDFPPPLAKPRALRDRAIYLRKNSRGVVKQAATVAAGMPVDWLEIQARGAIWLLRSVNGRAPVAERGPAGRRYTGAEVKALLLRTLDDPRAKPLGPLRGEIEAIPDGQLDQLALAHHVARLAWYEAGGE